MLNKVETRAFQIHAHGFSYMPLNPISWNSDYSKVQPNKSVCSTLTFKLSILLTIVIFIGLIYTLLYHFLIQTRINYNIVIIGIHTLGAMLASLLLAVSIALLKNPEAVQETNIFLSQQFYFSTRKFINYLRFKYQSVLTCFDT